MATALDNYLKTHRNRTALSLGEIAFLLGQRDSGTVGKHERQRRTPHATTVFAYEVVYGKPAKELFRGIYGRIERETVRRALELSKQLTERDPRTRSKQEALKQIYLPLTESTTGGYGQEW